MAKEVVISIVIVSLLLLAAIFAYHPNNERVLNLGSNEKVVFKVSGSNEIEITNESSVSINVARELALVKMKEFQISPGEAIVDKVPFDGTSYDYKVVVNNGSKSYTMRIKTPLSKSLKLRGPFYSYNQVKNYLRNFYNIIYINPNSEIYEIHIHGVRVKVAFFPDAVKVLPKVYRERLFTEAVRMFHRHWSMYRGFPTKEYRMIFWYRNSIPSGSESFIACHWLKWYIDDILRIRNFSNLEPLSHGIGHAWMGSAITLTNHRREVWWMEGMDHYNGIITLDNRMQYLRRDVEYVKRSPYKNLPLIEAGKLFGTKDAYLYYSKGGLFFYLVTVRLRENGKSWKDFMKYLYDKYFLSDNKIGQDQIRISKHLNSEKLKADLKNFSGVDFSDLFEKYVYGSEDITKEVKLDEKYLPTWDF